MSRVLVLHARMVAAGSFQPVAVSHLVDLHCWLDESVYLLAPYLEQWLALIRP